jgi:hypothetical protein
MRIKALLLILITIVLTAQASCDDDGPLIGIVDLLKYVDRRYASEYDKTDFWASIALSPSTGKFSFTCHMTSRDNAVIIARDNCNARDARTLVLCCNGWCSLALGGDPADVDLAWGVGWGADRETAEKFALESARKRASDAKIVFSIFAREIAETGAIAYSTTTGKWGYSYSYGRSDVARALNLCGDKNAEVFVTPKRGIWMALALGDDKSAYGWGYAGNRADAEHNALKECEKHTKNAKIAVSFCTNGLSY